MNPMILNGLGGQFGNLTLQGQQSKPDPLAFQSISERRQGGGQQLPNPSNTAKGVPPMPGPLKEMGFKPDAWAQMNQLAQNPMLRGLMGGGGMGGHGGIGGGGPGPSGGAVGGK